MQRLFGVESILHLLDETRNGNRSSSKKKLSRRSLPGAVT
jgi:hypothetical protein